MMVVLLDYAQARLKDSLVTSLKFTTAKEMELAWVDSKLHVTQSGEFVASPAPPTL